MLRSGNTHHDTNTDTQHHINHFILQFYTFIEYLGDIVCDMLTWVVPLLLLLCSGAAVRPERSCAWLSRYGDLSNASVSLLDQMVRRRALLQLYLLQLGYALTLTTTGTIHDVFVGCLKVLWYYM